MSLQAFNELGRRRMPDQLDLDTELGAERLRDLHDHGAGPLPLDLTGREVLHELRQMQSDPDLAGARDVSHTWLGCWAATPSAIAMSTSVVSSARRSACHDLPSTLQVGAITDAPRDVQAGLVNERCRRWPCRR